jgi:pullulanase
MVLAVGVFMFSCTVSNNPESELLGFDDANNSAIPGGLDSIGIGIKYTAASTTFSIWSPDTSDVKIWVNGTTYTCSAMTVSGYSGVYGVTVTGDLNAKEYYYLVKGVKVRDPYGMMYNNSTGNNVVVSPTISDPDAGWYAKPPMINREDAIVYEVHVRDFTIDPNSGVDAAKRGKFLGMVQTGTKDPNGKATGIDHLKELGVTHVQILPIYDFGSAQYNWGYDPVNYNVPEEQYCISTDPVERMKELKTMINEFHKNGIRVIMDVVYNHTYANDMFSGITSQYYDGLNLSGCGNSVDSGKPMVSRYIQDSLNYWASEYGVDGFRFDLIGIFYYSAVNQWGLSVNGNNPTANILMYGEPWNGYATDPNEGSKVRLGKVPCLSTGHVGAFNSKFREAIKGDSDGTVRGYMFNVIPSWIDQIKAGIRGSIVAVKSSSALADSWDSMFAYDPEQSVNYVAAHDNYCLWDKITHCGVTGTYAQRVDKFAAGILLTSQGIPFIHGGDEMLRTKVYNSDWTYAHNSYNAPDNYNMIRWQWKTDNSSVLSYYKGLIAMRKAHPAFKMTSWDQINSYCTTTTLTGGQVIINQINGTAVGDSWSSIIVVSNSGSNYTYTLPSGTWNVAVEKENSSVTGVSAAGTYVCEGTAITVFYQGNSVVVVPAAPTSITAAAASFSAVDISWTASDDATSYTVYKAASSSGTYTNIGTSKGTTFTASGLTAATSYYFKVTATNSAGTSGYSPVAAVTTSAKPAGLDVHFKVNTVADWNNVNCYYWGANGSPVTNTWPGAAMTYEGSGWYVFTIPSATTSSIIFDNGSVQTSDLSRTGEGWFVPTGTSSSKITGTWYSSNPDNVTTPVAPVSVTAAAATYSSIAVSWTASTGAASYTIYKATSSTGTYTSAGTATGTTFTVTGLTASTAYYFKVTATNSAGTSAYSAAAAATTPAQPAGLKVHFLVNSFANWTTPYCYYWASTGSPVSNTWPGAAMTSEGSSWWVFTIPGTVTSSNMIFNIGSSSAQSVDLNRTAEGWFVPTGTSGGKITGTWYSAKP